MVVASSRVLICFLNILIHLCQGDLVKIVTMCLKDAVLLIRVVFEEVCYSQGLFYSLEQITSLRTTAISFVKLKAHLFHAIMGEKAL